MPGARPRHVVGVGVTASGLALPRPCWSSEQCFRGGQVPARCRSLVESGATAPARSGSTRSFDVCGRSGERDLLLPREDGENLAIAQDDGFTLSERCALVQFPVCGGSGCTPHQPVLGGSAIDRVCAGVRGPAAGRVNAALRTLTYFRRTSSPGTQCAVTPSSFTACPPLIRGSVLLNPPWGNHARPVGVGRLANDPAAKSAMRTRSRRRRGRRGGARVRES